VKLLKNNNLEKLFFTDPLKKGISRNLEGIRLEYFYFNKELVIKTNKNEVLNGCLLKGDSTLIFEDQSYNLKQFGFFFLPPKKEALIGNVELDSKHGNKVCLLYSPIKKQKEMKFELVNINWKEFFSRGELSSDDQMATLREVWTALSNDYFISGFTNIPQDSLKQGVVTSVNVEDINNNKCIFPHIHPDFPEVYIFCIDNPNYAITQYLITKTGYSTCKELRDGDGVFFPGNLGHMNFAKPTLLKMKFCMYMWMIPTFGLTSKVQPITLRY